MAQTPKETVERFKELYLKHGKLAKEAARLCGLRESTGERLVTRLGLKSQRDTLEQLPEILRENVKEQVVRAVVESASSYAKKQVDEHLKGVLDTTGNVMRQLSANLKDEMRLPCIVEHASADTAIRSYARLVDLQRQAMGLPDQISAVSLGGSVGVHENALSVLSSCKILVRDGKADARTIDIETLKAEMLEDAKPHES